MAIDETTERIIIEFLGKYEFDAMPWRVPFEAEAAQGIKPVDFMKKEYANVINDKQAELVDVIGPFDIIAVRNKNVYFFLVKKVENNMINFVSEDERETFLEAKKNKAKIYVMTNPYPEHLFKVYNVSRQSIKNMKINLNKCKEVDLSSL